MAARDELTRVLEVIGQETVKGKAIHMLAEGLKQIGSRPPLTTAPITVADATDLPTALALANALKAGFNQLVQELGGGGGGA